MGLVKTNASEKALQMAQQYNLRLTSGYRSPDHPLSKSNPKSDHIKGLAYDFAGSFGNMKKFATWAHNSGMYKQVIFENKDYATGRYIGGHMDHVHIAWNKEGSSVDGVLNNGDKGGLVETIQDLLGNLKIDGIFGDKTEEAVKDFQEKHNLTVDGLVGKNTWEALTKGGFSFFS